MDKKIITIIVLSIIIVGLILLVFSGKSATDIATKALREQRIEFDRSTEIIERQLDSVQKYNKELESYSTELERINKASTTGNKETESYLQEYGGINSDFAEFLRQATVTD